MNFKKRLGILYDSIYTQNSVDLLLQLDSARIAASKMSPMMETVNYVSLDPVEVKVMYQSTNQQIKCMIVISLQCVQYIDSAVLVELIPRLTDLIKSGIGIGTKVSLFHLYYFYHVQ